MKVGGEVLMEIQISSDLSKKKKKILVPPISFSLQ